MELKFHLELYFLRKWRNHSKTVHKPSCHQPFKNFSNFRKYLQVSEVKKEVKKGVIKGS